MVGKRERRGNREGGREREGESQCIVQVIQ
jgi:hypothetical protein